MTEPPEQIMKRRLAEAESAATLIGATYHCLHERDGLVVYDKPTIHKTMELFRSIGPSMVFTHPVRDYMMDHEAVAQLARGASFLACAPNASTSPLEPDVSLPYLYYCDPVEGIDPLGNPAGATTRVDITAVMEQKAQMLMKHASQREWLRAHHGMDEYVQAMKRMGATRGAERHCTYAEGFTQHRGHAYPRNDLLAELFP
jgi:LmbE family N-acetylglucosaminyl deacetylase